MHLRATACIAFIGVTVMAFSSPTIPQEAAQAEETTQLSELPSVNELIEEAASLADRLRWEEAIQILTLALEIEPNNGLAHANRALAFASTNRLSAASSDLAAAEAVIPGHAIIDRVRAMIAMRRSDDETALSALSKSLELEPGNPFSLYYRAWILHRHGKEASALADAEAYIRARPQDPDAYKLRADLLLAQQKPGLAAQEAKRLSALFPGNPYAMATAARIYSAVGDRTRALQEITSAINERPDFSHYYLLRAKFRRWDDLAGRRKDLAAALSLQPADLGVIVEAALLDFQESHWSQAVAKFSIILTLEPKDFGVLAYRAMAREMLGDKANAARDYAAAMAAASGSSDFNRICDSLAFVGIALEKALDACNRAILLDPDEGRYRGTRGVVFLRLGRLDSSLADFDAAIAGDKRLAQPFYGRALAHWKKGDRANAQADLDMARSIDPTIHEKFNRHGFLGLSTAIKKPEGQQTR